MNLQNGIFCTQNIQYLAAFIAVKQIPVPEVETRIPEHITTCLGVREVLRKRSIHCDNKIPFNNLGGQYIFKFQAIDKSGSEQVMISGYNFLHQTEIILAEVNPEILRRFDGFCEFSLSYLISRH